MKMVSVLQVVAVVGVVLSVSTALYAEITIKPVLKRGDQAPGLPDGVKINSITDVQINDRGEVLFVGKLDSGGVTQENDQGIWIGRPGELRLAVREGDKPDLDGEDAEFGFLGVPILLDSGAAVFYAQLRGPGISTDSQSPGNDDSTWAVHFYPRNLAQPQNSGRVPRNDPDRQSFIDYGVRFAFLKRAGFTDKQARGMVCYLLKDEIEFANAFGDSKTEVEARGTLDYKREKEGIDAVPQRENRDEESELEPAVRAIVASGLAGRRIVTFGGESAAGTDAEFSNFFQAVQSRGGRSAVSATTTTGAGIWFSRGGALKPIAISGTPIPVSLGLDGNWRKEFERVVGLNSRGEVVFTNGLGSNQILVAGMPDKLRLVARGRQGQEEGFVLIRSEVAINTAGDVAFTALHSSFQASAIGVWVTHRRSEPRLVIAEGETAHGLREGEVISFIEEGPYMNRLGQVAVRASIGPGVGFQNTEDTGLWLVNPGEPAQLVVRGGTKVDVGGGEMREFLPRFAVSSLPGKFSGGEDGRQSPLNDHGQIAFVGQWQEPGGQVGTGIFVASDPSAKLDFDTWAKVLHRLEGADALPLADPNRNGIPNIVEFGLNGTPDDPGSAPILRDPELDHLGFPILYLYKAPGIAGLRYEVEHSSNGGDWTTDGLTVIEDSDTVLHVRVDNPGSEELFRVGMSLEGG